MSGPPPKPVTRASRLAQIHRLERRATASSLSSLIAMAADSRDVAEAAEIAFLKLYNRVNLRGVRAEEANWIKANHELGRWLAEAYQVPGSMPADLRRKMIDRLLQSELPDSNLGVDETVGIQWVCGTGMFMKPDLLSRLIPRELPLTIARLRQPDYRHKGALIWLMRVQDLIPLLPTLAEDASSSVRVRAVAYAALHRIKNLDAMLSKAAEDRYAAVREACARQLGSASAELRERLRTKFLADPIAGVRAAVPAASPGYIDIRWSGMDNSKDGGRYRT